MFIDLDYYSLRKQKFYFAPISSFFIIFLFFFFNLILNLEFNTLNLNNNIISYNFYYLNWSNFIFIDEISLQTLAFILYDRYYFTFILCGILLLLAIMGSILITSQLTKEYLKLIEIKFVKDFLFLNKINEKNKIKEQIILQQNTKIQVNRFDTTKFY